MWSDRTQNAMILAPSIETCQGHVVRTQSGTLMHTTALFRGAVQPSPQPVIPASAVARIGPLPLSAPPGPEVSVQFPSGQGPTRRITGKQADARASDQVFKVRNMSALQGFSQAAAALLTCRPVPFRTAAALVVSSPDLWDVARSMPNRLSAGESSKYLLFGWYKHGGLTGVTTITQAIPGLVRLLNALLGQVHPTGTWTTLALFSSAVAAPHTDPRNLKPSYNYVLPLALPQGEHCLWVANPLDCPLEPWIWQSPSLLRFLPALDRWPACVC